VGEKEERSTYLQKDEGKKKKGGILRQALFTLWVSGEGKEEEYFPRAIKRGGKKKGGLAAVFVGFTTTGWGKKGEKSGSKIVGILAEKGGRRGKKKPARVPLQLFQFTAEEEGGEERKRNGGAGVELKKKDEEKKKKKKKKDDAAFLFLYRRGGGEKKGGTGVLPSKKGQEEPPWFRQVSRPSFRGGRGKKKKGKRERKKTRRTSL